MHHSRARALLILVDRVASSLSSTPTCLHDSTCESTGAATDGLFLSSNALVGGMRDGPAPQSTPCTYGSPGCDTVLSPGHATRWNLFAHAALHSAQTWQVRVENVVLAGRAVYVSPNIGHEKYAYLQKKERIVHPMQFGFDVRQVHRRGSGLLQQTCHHSLR
jgi:hypothetical protein